MKGDRDQLPQWDDDFVDVEEEEEEEEEEEADNEDIKDKSVSQSLLSQQSQKVPKKTTLFGAKPQQPLTKSLNPFEIMMRKQTNTVKYRNNFTSREFKVKDEGIFSKCLKCRNTYENCWCHYKSQGQFLSVEINNDPKDYDIQIYLFQE